MYKSKEAVRGGGSWCFRILRASLRKRLEGFRFLGGEKRATLGARRWHDTSTNGWPYTNRLGGHTPVAVSRRRLLKTLPSK